MNSRADILPLVLADLAARMEKGAAEHGEPLRTHNGRDALHDAYEEALDLALYLRQAIEERGPLCNCHNCGRRGPVALYVPHTYGRGTTVATRLMCPACSPLVDARDAARRPRRRYT
jgi:hypothetical protein